MADDDEDSFEGTPLQRQQRLEQGNALIAENMPTFWWRLYSNCRKEGFDDKQSMSLLRAYIRGLFSGGR